MKRIRPPMPPLTVRVQVAERQAEAQSSKWGPPIFWPNYLFIRFTLPLNERLRRLLKYLFHGLPCALDHDPALVLRKYNLRIKDVASRYTPHAHDPDALIYREKADHQQKTTGRKPGAERTVTTKGSDIGLKTKFARLEKKKRKPRTTITPRGFGAPRKMRISSRPFSKGRGFRKPRVDRQ